MARSKTNAAWLQQLVRIGLQAGLELPADTDVSSMTCENVSDELARLLRPTIGHRTSKRAVILLPWCCVVCGVCVVVPGTLPSPPPAGVVPHAEPLEKDPRVALSAPPPRGGSRLCAGRFRIRGGSEQSLPHACAHPLHCSYFDLLKPPRRPIPRVLSPTGTANPKRRKGSRGVQVSLRRLA